MCSHHRRAMAGRSELQWSKSANIEGILRYVLISWSDLEEYIIAVRFKSAASIDSSEFWNKIIMDGWTG